MSWKWRSRISAFSGIRWNDRPAVPRDLPLDGSLRIDDEGRRAARSARSGPAMGPARGWADVVGEGEGQTLVGGHQERGSAGDPRDHPGMDILLPARSLGRAPAHDLRQTGARSAAYDAPDRTGVDSRQGDRGGDPGGVALRFG